MFQFLDTSRFRFLRAMVGSTAAWIALLAATQARVAANDTEFFENRVRPILADRCYSCHSADAKKIQGGLRLDSFEALRKGGPTGPLFLAGNPEDSLLIQVVRGTAKELDAMPPKGEKLSEDQIGILAEWVRQGAPLPATTASSPTSPSKHVHWAFQKPVAKPLPSGGAALGSSNPIDLWLAKSLQDQGLRAAARADRHVLLRRLTFDITGLPPSMEEMAQFVTDRSHSVYERAVDRLLASPRYGERWGRHWLDVARYADTKGYVFEEERRYTASFTYRDWVVSALNHDLAYDQFLIAQIAGDSLATDSDKTPLAALGFLTLGRRFLNNAADIIDDRLDVIFRGTQGLSVQCARCHDHKFDPISIRDYYSLYGVFASSHEPDPKPLIGANPNSVLSEQYDLERRRREQERRDFQSEKVEQARKELRERAGEYLLAVRDAREVGKRREELIRARKLSPVLVKQWETWLEKRASAHDSVLGAYAELSKFSTNEFTARATEWRNRLLIAPETDRHWNGEVRAIFLTNALTDFKAVADGYGDLFKGVQVEWLALTAAAKSTGSASPGRLPNDDREALRQILYSADSPVMVDWDVAYRLVPTPDQQKFRALQRRLDELDATHPGAPLRAMAMVDNAKPVEPVVFKRGNPGSPGPVVPRQFLEILDPNRQPFKRGSGRYELATSIASVNNPLTARVFVNRVWMHYFGAPLVRTPSDFGVRSDPPSHPELLDWLSVWFMEQGWSIKRLHRLIVTSDAYQRTSDPAKGPETEHSEQVDPSNALLWRMNRKRADFEGLRDSLLFVSGNLDMGVGGQPVEIYTDRPTNRRTLYGFIDRQNLPGVLRAFDFASPDTSASMRFQTTVPQQALYLLNSSFSAELSRQLVERTEVRTATSDDDRIRRLFALTFQREPARDELAAALDFVQSKPSTNSTVPQQPTLRENGMGNSTSITPLNPWGRLAQALLASNEFVFVD